MAEVNESDPAAHDTQPEPLTEDMGESSSSTFASQNSSIVDMLYGKEGSALSSSMMPLC